MTAPTLKLSDLAPGDVAVFVYPDGCEGDPFAVEEYHGVTMVRTENQRTSFDAEGGLHPVRRLGRGRLEPAKIVMEVETGADLAAQVRTLRQFARECAMNFDCDNDAHRYQTLCRKCEARAALAATAPTEAAK